MRHLKSSLNRWKSIGPALVSQIFFSCVIFDCYNISICKKRKVKDEEVYKTTVYTIIQVNSKLVQSDDRDKFFFDVNKNLNNTYIFSGYFK